MYGPYSAQIEHGKRVIHYLGNNISQEIENIHSRPFNFDTQNRVQDIAQEVRFLHLHNIDNAIFFAAVDYFKQIGAEWCNLPTTTLMISSPGEVYAGQTLDYTTDTLPVDVSWFENKRRIFFSESSQFYLELRLLIRQIDQVFSIYNSFRKERADFSHLSEFQHIEYEGCVDFNKNINILTGLLSYIVTYILDHNDADLKYFLSGEEIKSLRETFHQSKFSRLTFKEALKLLYEATNDDTYRVFSMKNFGAWEEIKLTELLGTHVIITHFPLLQIPFYHNSPSIKDEEPVAENADIILYGYRETAGSGVRISDKNVLREKARIFNLPPDDYEPYLQMRDVEGYRKTAGFGLGWQRFTHWLLKLPTIWDACHVPRGHVLPRP